jgi:hypothetical protein
MWIGVEHLPVSSTVQDYIARLQVGGRAIALTTVFETGSGGVGPFVTVTGRVRMRDGQIL